MEKKKKKKEKANNKQVEICSLNHELFKVYSEYQDDDPGQKGTAETEMFTWCFIRIYSYRLNKFIERLCFSLYPLDLDVH